MSPRQYSTSIRSKAGGPSARRRKAATSTCHATDQQSVFSLLDTILDNMTQGVAVFDAELRLVIFNRHYVELFGYPPDVVRIGASYEDIVRYNVMCGGIAVSDVEAHVQERLSAARDYGVARRLEHIRPDGTVIAVRRGPIPGGGFINTYTDITQRKRAEDEAKRNAELLQATLEHMADGIRVFDKDLNLAAWNTKSFEMLGYPPEMRRVGTPYAAFIDYNARRGGYKDEDPVEGRKMRLERARQARGRSSEHISPDGRIIQKHRNPMPGGGFVSTYQDVTERKNIQMMLLEAKERAELASRSKSDFLANMSHELRTPLNAIIGFAEIMCDELMGPLGSSSYREYAQGIRESGAHLLAIINDILDLSKIEAGGIQLSEEAVNLRDVVQSCLRLIEKPAVHGRVKIANVLPAYLPHVRGDARMLKQIVLNLLSNAVKFTPEGGEVTVTAELIDGLTLIVSDTGIGIAEEDIAKALTPFMQVDNSLSRRFEGTGLGLPLAASFTRLHGGTLTLQSKPGRGTRVRVHLPSARLVLAG